MQLRHRRHRSAIALTAGLLAVVTGVSTTASFAAGQHQPRAGAEQHSDPGADARGGFDARRGTGDKARAALLRDAARAASRPETRRLRGSLGDHALLDLDGATGTPRLLTRLDGFLTGRSSQGAAKVTLGYVADHHDALGLSRRDLKTFHLRRDYVDVDGTHHLSWTQKIGGVDVFGNGLQSAVTDGGRLVSLGGSPVSGASAASTAATRLDTGAQAISAARTEQGDTASPGARDTARQVLFVTRSGTHLGWSTVTMSAAHPTLTVLDAHTGGLLFRRPLSSDATATDAKDAPKSGSGGLAFPYFPRAPRGGNQVSVDYTAKGWLDANATKLSGNNSHAYSDVNDDDSHQGTEEAAPSAGHRWDYALKPFTVPSVSFCDNPYPCSWDPNVPFSWQANRAQNVAQVFFFVNNWHDHLLDAPIGFTEAAGNFQLRNSTRGGVAGDAVDTQTDDGANTANGLPDGVAHRQREHEHPARRPGADDADVPPAPARHVVPGRGPVLADQRRGRGGHRLPRVHPRPVEPAGRRRVRQLHPRRGPGRVDGRGLERLVRHGLPRRPGPPARHPRHRRHRALPVRRRRHRRGPHRAAGLQGRRHHRGLHGRRDRAHRRLHLRRLRPGERQPRGARGR